MSRQNSFAVSSAAVKIMAKRPVTPVLNGVRKRPRVRAKEPIKAPEIQPQNNNPPGPRPKTYRYQRSGLHPSRNGYVQTPPPTECDSQSDEPAGTPSTSGHTSRDEQLATLKEENDHYKELYRKSQREYSALRGEKLLQHSKVLADQEELEAENRVLRQRLQKAREVAQPASFQQEEKLASVEKKVSDLKKELKTVRAENAQLNDEKGRLKAKIRDLDDKYGNLEIKLRSDCSHWERETSSLTKTLEEQSQQYEAKIKNLRTQIQTVKKDLENEKKANSEFQSNITKCKDEQRERDTSELKSEILVLEQKLKESKSLACTLEKTIDETAKTLEEEIASATNKLKKQKADFQTQVAEARQQLKEKEKFIQQHISKMDGISAALAERETVTGILEDLFDAAVVDAEQGTTKATNLALALENLQEARSDLEEELEFYKRQLREERHRTSEQDATISQMQAFLDWKDTIAGSLHGGVMGKALSDKYWDRWSQAYLRGRNGDLLAAVQTGRSLEEALMEVETVAYRN